VPLYGAVPPTPIPILDNPNAPSYTPVAIEAPVLITDSELPPQVDALFTIVVASDAPPPVVVEEEASNIPLTAAEAAYNGVANPVVFPSPISLELLLLEFPV
jgi:hypothetical protein